METKQFETLLERIRIGSYPSMTGSLITVDQFLRIQDICTNLVNLAGPDDNRKLSLISGYLVGWKLRVDDTVELEKRLYESLNAKMGLFEAIQKLIDAYQTDDSKDCILLINGDNVNKKAQFSVYGDVQQVAMAFAALLDSENSNFKRLIFSIIGSYIAKNPEDEKMFMRGIDEVKKYTPGVN